MKRGLPPLVCLALCGAMAACNSGPSRASRADEAAAVRQKIDDLESLLARRPLAGQVLQDVQAALPDLVWLTEAVYGQGHIRLKGRAPSIEGLAQYVSRLGESRSLRNLSLGGSVSRTVAGRTHIEFLLEADVPEPGHPPAPSGVAAAVRLDELEKSLPVRPDSAAILRTAQRPAQESGVQVAAVQPGSEAAGESAAALPVKIEVTGDPDGVARYLQGLAAAEGLWVVDGFSFRAVVPDDRRSAVRASISVRACFAR